MQHTINILQRFAKGDSDYAQILEANLSKSYPNLLIKSFANFNKFAEEAKNCTANKNIFLLCPEYLKANEIKYFEQITAKNNLRYLSLHEQTERVHLLADEIEQLKNDDYAYIDGLNYLIPLKNRNISTLLYKYANWSKIKKAINNLIKQTRQITCSVFLNYPYSTEMNKKLLTLARECQQISEKCIYVPLVDLIECSKELHSAEKNKNSSSVWLDFSFAGPENIAWQNYLLKTQLDNTYLLSNISSMLLSSATHEPSTLNWQNFWQSLYTYCQMHNYRLICQISALNSSAAKTCLHLAEELYAPNYLLQASTNSPNEVPIFSTYQKELNQACKIISCELPALYS